MSDFFDKPEKKYAKPERRWVPTGQENKQGKRLWCSEGRAASPQVEAIVTLSAVEKLIASMTVAEKNKLMEKLRGKK